MLFAEHPSQSPRVRWLSLLPEGENTTGKEAGVAAVTGAPCSVTTPGMAGKGCEELQWLSF